MFGLEKNGKECDLVRGVTEGLATRSLVCHAKEFGLCPEDHGMPMKGFKLGVIGTNDPISSDSQGVG
jgi:hypothetical protein